MSDEWFDFPGHEDRYQITQSGAVRSKPRLVNSPAAGGQRRIRGKILKPALVKGYLAVQPTISGKRITAYVHRALGVLFVPNPCQETSINHIDGNKANNAIENLEWCSHKENMRHAFRTGLVPYPKTGPGEMSPSAKLNDIKVRDIKVRLAAGQSHKSIALIYGVVPSTIAFIATGATWSHIQ
jgi:hypothetical protein